MSNIIALQILGTPAWSFLVLALIGFAAQLVGQFTIRKQLILAAALFVAGVFGALAIFKLTVTNAILYGVVMFFSGLIGTLFAYQLRKKSKV